MSAEAAPVSPSSDCAGTESGAGVPSFFASTDASFPSGSANDQAATGVSQPPAGALVASPPAISPPAPGPGPATTFATADMTGRYTTSRNSLGS